MRTICLLGLLCATWASASNARAELEIRTEGLEMGPDSLPQEGVPKGRLEGSFEFHSEILEGTVRRY